MEDPRYLVERTCLGSWRLFPAGGLSGERSLRRSLGSAGFMGAATLQQAIWKPIKNCLPTTYKVQTQFEAPSLRPIGKVPEQLIGPRDLLKPTAGTRSCLLTGAPLSSGPCDSLWLIGFEGLNTIWSFASALPVS